MTKKKPDLKKKNKPCLEKGTSIKVEFAYAGRNQQILKIIKIPPGISVEKAIVLSKIQEDIKDVYPLEGRVGIFGKQVSLNTRVKAGNRIEIYQPLYFDPKDLRKIRAAKQKHRNQKDKN